MNPVEMAMLVKKNPADLPRLLANMERKLLPIEVRVENRLRELDALVHKFNKRKRSGKFRNAKEWARFRRFVRHGLRISNRFNNDWGKNYFGMLFRTATSHLRADPESPLCR